MGLLLQVQRGYFLFLFFLPHRCFHCDFFHSDFLLNRSSFFDNYSRNDVPYFSFSDLFTVIDIVVSLKVHL